MTTKLSILFFPHQVPVNLSHRESIFTEEDGYEIQEIEAGRVRVRHTVLTMGHWITYDGIGYGFREAVIPEAPPTNPQSPAAKPQKRAR